MPWTHIFAPTKGMITNVPSTLLPKEASPWIKGMYLKDGEAVSDFGYVDYPTPAATNPVIRAAVPEVTARAYLAPIFLATSVSSSLTLEGYSSGP